jgi:hypothetical protein
MKKATNWIELGQAMAEMFTSNHLVFCELLVSGNSMRMILVTLYEKFWRENKLLAIEVLPREQKLVLWETAKDFSKGRLLEGELTELSKSFYVLEYLLQ